jgi:hypothetical protein
MSARQTGDWPAHSSCQPAPPPSCTSPARGHCQAGEGPQPPPRRVPTSPPGLCSLQRSANGTLQPRLGCGARDTAARTRPRSSGAEAAHRALLQVLLLVPLVLGQAAALPQEAGDEPNKGAAIRAVGAQRAADEPTIEPWVRVQGLGGAAGDEADNGAAPGWQGDVGSGWRRRATHEVWMASHTHVAGGLNWILHPRGRRIHLRFKILQPRSCGPRRQPCAPLGPVAVCWPQGRPCRLANAACEPQSGAAAALGADSQEH